MVFVIHPFMFLFAYVNLGEHFLVERVVLTRLFNKYVNISEYNVLLIFLRVG